jgi:TRAP-type uncharacterized transport system substrate-binding protein
MDAENKVISWTSADNNDIASFDDFAAKRVFVTSKEMIFSEDTAVIRSAILDFGFAYMTSELTETEVKDLKERNKDIVLSVFRVL